MIRKAYLSDAASIAKVHVDSWHTTYKSIVPDEFLKQLSYEQRTELWIKNLGNKNNYVFVEENANGDIIGFICGGKRDTNQMEESTDLTAIYLLQQYQGAGIGKKLVKQLFARLEDLGYKRVFVEVLAENHSCKFYEALGATLYKTDSITIGGDKLSLLVYEWRDIRSLLKAN